MAQDLLSLSLAVVRNIVQKVSKSSIIPSGSSPDIVYPLLHIFFTTDSAINQRQCIGALIALCEKNNENCELVCENRTFVPFLLSILVKERKQDFAAFSKSHVMMNEILTLLGLLCYNSTSGEEAAEVISGHWNIFFEILQRYGFHTACHRITFLLEKLSLRDDCLRRIFHSETCPMLPLLVENLWCYSSMLTGKTDENPMTLAIIESILTILCRCVEIDNLCPAVVKELVKVDNFMYGAEGKWKPDPIPVYLVWYFSEDKEKIRELAGKLVFKIRKVLPRPPGLRNKYQ